MVPKKTIIIGIIIVVALFMIREMSLRMLPKAQTNPVSINSGTAPDAAASTGELVPTASQEPVAAQGPADPAKETPKKFEILVQ